MENAAQLKLFIPQGWSDFVSFNIEVYEKDGHSERIFSTWKKCKKLDKDMVEKQKIMRGNI